MSVYLIMGISGNEQFGGYLSVDGEKSVSIVNGDFLKLSPGQHSLQIHSTSDAQRKMGKTQAALYNNTSSSGILMDTLERKSALSNLGDSWNINVHVADGQAIYLNVLTKGEKFLADPTYCVEDMSEDMEKDLDEKYEAWVNTPIRSKKLMIWGIVLAFLGVFGVSNFFTQGGMEEYGIAGFIVLALLIPLGGWLFYSGFKKKVRRK